MEIAKLYGQDTISLNTIYRRYKRHREGDRSLGDKSTANSKPKFSDGYLIQLIKDNPKFSIADLASASGCSTTTMSRRLKQINDRTKQSKGLLKSTKRAVDMINNELGVTTAAIEVKNEYGQFDIPYRYSISADKINVKAEVPTESARITKIPNGVTTKTTTTAVMSEYGEFNISHHYSISSDNSDDSL
ncbi:hypothetical protein CONCODRAFT_79425 [Conidiobolus coronatus NRRL 28638]|uniref:Uncharacterized protein n=1 Tax=Conidiobolus coronatus (strain ATCC 28846 / CBS 209.66 / NRRL 28638) TaxID=796925 RepID=A0A137P2N3_CONC2|nr:hypothetical protein CONCODRAFT_79425 [Conidiobolus coronatus NRRL 28638]|eukprot:KXN69218.1 hypothetical protein CONCODRAFT_79425 [Conidiobolus coronatus NRRL 28638]